METEVLSPERQGDIPLGPGRMLGSGETALQPPQTPKKSRLRRLWILLPVALLAALGVALALNWTAVTVYAAPRYALLRGAEGVAPLPQPVSLGLLGEGTLEGKRVQFSGTLDVQADGAGLALALGDFTLGGEGLSVSLSGYLSAREAALSIPSLTGGQTEYYGLRLDEPILSQVKGTGGDPEYGWYFHDGDIRRMQSAADGVREALAAVKEIAPSQAERDALAAFFRNVRGAGELGEEGYLLRFSAPEQAVDDLLEALELPGGWRYGGAEVTCRLNPEGILTAVEAEGQGARFSLELGDDPAQELAPRLELVWPDGDGGENTVTVAVAAAPCDGVEPPEYENAFSLLPRF